jgi:MOSC domain-containing protein YiiM
MHSGHATPPTVVSVHAGTARGLMVGGRRVLTAIAKFPQAGPVEVKPLGLVGDEQVDLSYHGGLDQAVYAYPSEHLAFWSAQRAIHQPGLFESAVTAGMVGENLSIRGLLETEVYVGDTLHIGTSVALRVTRYREPCGTFNAVMGYPQAAKDMIQRAFTGFYLRVITPGFIQAGDTITLTHGAKGLCIADMARGKWAKHSND